MAARFFLISRDMDICPGDKCGECYKHLPTLADGDLRVADWAMRHNSAIITKAYACCPGECLNLREL